MIEARIRGQQAEAKPVLARRFAVTGARVAAQLREDREDLGDKPNRSAIGEVGHRHTHDRGPTRFHDAKGRLAVSGRPDSPPTIDRRHERFRSFVAQALRSRQVRRPGTGDDELSAGVGAAEDGVRRIDVNPLLAFAHQNCQRHNRQSPHRSSRKTAGTGLTHLLCHSVTTFTTSISALRDGRISRSADAFCASGAYNRIVRRGRSVLSP